MYLLANELPVSGERGKGFSDLLTRAHAVLKEWDPTRPYIGNAGYGKAARATCAMCTVTGAGPTTRS